MSDWVGNSNSIFKTHGASNHCENDREINDFYATPPIATNALIRYCQNNNIDIFSKTIFEPACGKGHISECFKNIGCNVISHDLVDRNYADKLEDFLQTNYENLDYNIITNPPYKFAKEFVEKSIESINNDNYVCMLLKITFLEGTKRLEMFKKYPPYKILIFSDRINCSAGGDFNKDSELGGAVGYAWYIWKKGNNNLPTIDWITAKDDYNVTQKTNKLF
jgi:hypothetical protein